MKYKHNKKKNTAFLYESLIIELSRASINKNVELRNSILCILKESFNKNTNLGKELKIYKDLINTKNVDDLTAEKIILEAKREHSSLNQLSIFKEQNILIAKLRQLSPSLFSNFIPNYKDLASVSQIFNKDLSIKTRVLLENEIHKKMLSSLLQETKMQPIDNLIINSFTKRFNEEYKDLFPEQKKLLEKFITSFSDNALGLKIFLNEEITRLKTEVNKIALLRESLTNTEIQQNTQKVVNYLKECVSKPIDQEMIGKILKIQKLLRDIN